jgi:ligand-binding SRPBCC domain-containing protein
VTLPRTAAVGASTGSAAARAGSTVRFSHSEGGGARILASEQWVAASQMDTFTFFSDAGNLAALTPPFLKFCILTPLPIEMRTGTLIRYRLKVMGLPLEWLTRIEDWRPGEGFTDTQLRGPYARWIHRHTFTPGDGGTWVRDEVEYALPLAPVSNPFHVLFVRPMLERIFTHRRDAIARIVG